MDVSQSLLVAMMFITVISISMTNILMALSAIANPRCAARTHWIWRSWILLLLLFHLNLFWDTLLILEVEDWHFAGFLFIVTGPIALLVATGILLPDLAGDKTHTVEHYLEIAPRFFLVLVCISIWLICLDALFGGGLTWTSAWNIGESVIFLYLAFAKSARVHQCSSFVVWFLFLLQVLLRGTSVMD